MASNNNNKPKKKDSGKINVEIIQDKINIFNEADNLILNNR